jgi:predicted membrane-bound spermidine synthase
LRPLLFLFFFVSGFCGLLYQVVWTRLAFASFGIITPVLSVVISVFMLGLGLGSWAGGRWIGALVARTRLSALTFYAAVEFLIGLGAFAVPALFRFGTRLLLSIGEMGSLQYLSLSALVLAVSILPWCLLMGATFPFMMAFVHEKESHESHSFSHLYLANVLGATSGTLLTAFVLVEKFGFQKTLWLAAAGNFFIASLSLILGLRTTKNREPLNPAVQNLESGETRDDPVTSSAGTNRSILWLLFWTGFVSLAMEVLWMRAFTPILKTQIYSFALVLATYLGATFAGSLWYRHGAKRNRLVPRADLIALLCLAVFLPILANDARWLGANELTRPDAKGAFLLLLSICPFCALLGYLTPRLVDEFSGGSPVQAGRAYATNVLGCILGPLFASYILMPRLPERYSLILSSVPLFVFYLTTLTGNKSILRRAFGFTAIAALIAALFFSRSFEDSIFRFHKEAVAHRDYAASVLSYGEGRSKRLLVNGIGMTTLTPITKFMVHLPLALQKQRPASALIICFGMGTSYRSALSWDVETTAVELVPSVKDAFGFYHADAATCLANPKGKIIIDDGRRYLMRTREKFDVIIVDPPPPPEAAGSSLLYSAEFYDLAKQHLKPGGILQAWVPLSGGPTTEAAARSIQDSFPYVHCFQSIERFGRHFLASMEPIAIPGAAELAARFPSSAATDLQEWSSAPGLKSYLDQMLSKEFPMKRVLNSDPEIRITDDKPFNEYFFLRQGGLFAP